MGSPHEFSVISVQRIMRLTGTSALKCISSFCTCCVIWDTFLIWKLYSKTLHLRSLTRPNVANFRFRNTAFSRPENAALLSDILWTAGPFLWNSCLAEHPFVGFVGQAYSQLKRVQGVRAPPLPKKYAHLCTKTNVLRAFSRPKMCLRLGLRPGARTPLWELMALPQSLALVGG